MLNIDEYRSPWSIADAQPSCGARGHGGYVSDVLVIIVPVCGGAGMRTRLTLRPTVGMSQTDTGGLSDCNRILNFPSEFPDIPRKISAYLRTDFPSDANTRNIRGFYNILNINDLCSRRISSHCKKHHFGLRNGPFQRLKSTISHPKMDLIALRNGQYWKVKCII